MHPNTKWYSGNHWRDTHRIHGAAIYGNIYHQYTPNVSIYTIHGSYGIWRPTKIVWNKFYSYCKRWAFIASRLLGAAAVAQVVFEGWEEHVEIRCENGQDPSGWDLKHQDTKTSDLHRYSCVIKPGNWKSLEISVHGKNVNINLGKHHLLFGPWLYK